MNSQQLHQQTVPQEFLYSVEPEDFAQLQGSDQLMHGDFDIEEYESGYAEESLPNYLLAFIKETDWE